MPLLLAVFALIAFVGLVFLLIEVLLFLIKVVILTGCIVLVIKAYYYFRKKYSS